MNENADFLHKLDAFLHKMQLKKDKKPPFPQDTARWRGLQDNRCPGPWAYPAKHRPSPEVITILMKADASGNFHFQMNAS